MIALPPSQNASRPISSISTFRLTRSCEALRAAGGMLSIELGILIAMNYQHTPTGKVIMPVLRLLMVAIRIRMKNRADEYTISKADFAAYVRTIGWDLQDVPAESRKQHLELLPSQRDTR